MPKSWEQKEAGRRARRALRIDPGPRRGPVDRGFFEPLGPTQQSTPAVSGLAPKGGLGLKVNYLIAASSHRVGRDPSLGIETKDILRLHIQQLLKTDTAQLAQVTLLRALPLLGCGTSPQNQADTRHFWDVGGLVKDLKCPFVTLDVPNRHFSYSSWIQAAQRYRQNFDYYILVEDDYYPALSNFVDVLVRLHTRKLPMGGYLCGYARPHAAVCNGIVDASTFCRALDKYPDPIEAIAPAAQTRFLCKPTFDNEIADYTDEYRTLFRGGWKGICYQTHDRSLVPTEDIINPIEYLATGERDFS